MRLHAAWLSHGRRVRLHLFGGKGDRRGTTIKNVCIASSFLILLLIRILWSGHTRSGHGNVAHRLERGFTIYVLLHKRPGNSKLLLKDLHRSDYHGNKVNLHIVVDKDSEDSREHKQVVKLAKGFSWVHGPQRLTVMDHPTGIINLWLSLGRECHKDSLFAVFEDDLRVSPLWFTWVLEVQAMYFQNAEDDTNILGLSLSPIRIIEMEYPYKSWDSTTHIAPNISLYLHHMPSSWGPVFRCSEWHQFLKYADGRKSKRFVGDEIADPVAGAFLGDGNFFLQNHFSNLWNKSWKKFLIEYSSLGGKVTMYPNILGQAGLASNLHLAGVHAKYRGINDHKTCPLLVDRSVDAFNFPLKEHLDVFDQHSSRTSLDMIHRDAFELRSSLLSLGEPYSHLLSHYSGKEGQPRSKPVMFLCPESKSLHHQLLDVILLLLQAREFNMNVVISHLMVPVDHGYELVPFSEVFNPPVQIGESFVRVATHYNLKQKRPKVVIIGSDYGAQCSLYSKIWGGTEMKQITIRQALSGYEDYSSEWLAASSSTLSIDALVKPLQNRIASPSNPQSYLWEVFYPNERTRMMLSHADSMIKARKRVCISTIGCSSSSCMLSLEKILEDVPQSHATIVFSEEPTAMNFNRKSTKMKLEEWAPLMSTGVSSVTAIFMELHSCIQAETIYVVQGSIFDSLLFAAPGKFSIKYLKM